MIGVSTGCYHPLDIVTEEAVDAIADLGADAVEVFIQGDAELTRERVDELARRTRQVPFEFISLHPYPFGWEHLLFGPYTRQRQWAHERFAEYLEVGAAIGASVYVSHGPPAHLVVQSDGRLSRRYVETSLALIDAAARMGMRYCLENVSYGVLRTPDDARAHLRDLPGLGLVLDLKSAWKAGVAPSDFLESELLSSVSHSQLSFRDDGRYGLPAGTKRGESDMSAVLEVPMPHILEIEARRAEDVGASLQVVRSMGVGR